MSLDDLKDLPVNNESQVRLMNKAIRDTKITQSQVLIDSRLSLTKIFAI